MIDIWYQTVQVFIPNVGLEPTTTRLKAGRSTYWANPAAISPKYYFIIYIFNFALKPNNCLQITNSYHTYSNSNASRTGHRQNIPTVDLSFSINLPFCVFFEFDFDSIPTCMCIQEREDQEPITHHKRGDQRAPIGPVTIVQYNTKDGKPYQQPTSNNQKLAALAKPPRRNIPTSSTLIGII